MSEEIRLTPTNLLAAAGVELSAGGYRKVEEGLLAGWPRESVRVYEDPYSIAAVAVYETWSELATGWVQLQESLVELISRFWTQADAKAWDGYLVLLTPAAPSSAVEAETIRYNTSRLRKLIATGDDLRRLSDVARVLAPLLPLESVATPQEERALDILPRLLARRGIDEGAGRALVRAFERQEPLVEALHSMGTKNETDSD